MLLNNWLKDQEPDRTPGISATQKNDFQHIVHISAPFSVEVQLYTDKSACYDYSEAFA